ncbi:MAG: YgiQ family radical SAM protein [Pseudomonadota bacterium]
MSGKSAFLPTTARELGGRADVVLVTGDAFVDHPSFGAALIGRWLASHGLKVGVIAQPDWHGAKDFQRLGRPTLFFGITAGCVDSLVANTTALGGRRRRDEYSPAGRPGLRPDRACIVYANRVHQANRAAFIVLGGIEASTRRLAHYDAWEDGVRRSILVDAGADIIAYGMAEHTVLAIVAWMRRGRDAGELAAMPGIVFSLPVREAGLIPADAVWLPDFDEVAASPDAFFKAHMDMRRHAHARVLVQPHDDRLVVQTPPALPPAGTLDRVYELPFTRRSHPCGGKGGKDVPGLTVVRFSLTAHRGCAGGCAFCALALVQRRVLSRSPESLLREAASLAAQDFFDGTITDVGGPTANMYAIACRKNQVPGACGAKRCLFPAPCKNLVVDHSPLMGLIRRMKKIPGVRHVFINSGIRHDLALSDARFLNFLFDEDVIGGQLSVAPEHASDSVLRLMGKPPFERYLQFEKLFYEKAQRSGKRYHLLPYFISSFPGSTLEDAFVLARHVNARLSYLRQIQDFTPTPLSDAACMYHTQRDLAGNPIHVARTREEKLMQRALVQLRNPRYRPHALEALARLGKSLADLTRRA